MIFPTISLFADTILPQVRARTRLNGNTWDYSLVHQEVPWVRSLHRLPGRKKRERVRPRRRWWMIMEERLICAARCVREYGDMKENRGRRDQITSAAGNQKSWGRLEEDRGVHGSKHTRRKGERKGIVLVLVKDLLVSLHGRMMLQRVKMLLLYPLSILSRTTRGSRGSRFTLQQQNMEL